MTEKYILLPLNCYLPQKTIFGKIHIIYEFYSQVNNLILKTQKPRYVEKVASQNVDNTSYLHNDYLSLLQATMIYAGFYTELLSCNPLNPIKLTMVRLDTVDI